MPKQIAAATPVVDIVNHMSTEELLVRYRQATEATERSHCQIIWLLATGKTVAEAA